MEINTTTSTVNYKRNFLLELPAEIRNRISELVVVQRSGITLFCGFNLHGDGQPHQPALSCVNRQLRSETLAIFYEMNIFVFDTTYSDFNRTAGDTIHIPASRVSQVKQVRFEVCQAFSGNDYSLLLDGKMKGSNLIRATPTFKCSCCDENDYQEAKNLLDKMGELTRNGLSELVEILQ